MIYLIATAANITENFQERKMQYIEGIKSIDTYYKIKPFIVETVSSTDYLNETFFSNYTKSLNKGVREFINIENFFNSKQFHFNDEDNIIKMTLRYKLTSSVLIDTILSNDYDVYCKWSKDLYGPHDRGIHSFLFSMKYKLWKKFLSEFDRSVHKDYPIELALSNFFLDKKTKYLDTLGIEARPMGLKTARMV
jgi:hypothetical protein